MTSSQNIYADACALFLAQKDVQSYFQSQMLVPKSFSAFEIKSVFYVTSDLM